MYLKKIKPYKEIRSKYLIWDEENFLKHKLNEKNDIFDLI